MTKVYFFNLFSKIGVQINTKTLERLFLVSYGIVQSKSVNISLINDEIRLEESGCKNDVSQYTYLLKLFQTGNYENLIKSCFRIIVIHFYGGEKDIKILIDRTNWDLGSRKINILTLGILTSCGTFIPLIWDDLGYKGNSDSATRLKLIERLLSWWKEMQIPLPIFEIIGDREFIGEQWLCSLSRLGLKYVIRLRSDLTFEPWLEDEYKLDFRMGLPTIHEYIDKNQVPCVEIVLAGEAIANVFVVKNNATQTYKNTDIKPQDPYIYFISNLDELEIAAQHYQERWKIEVCFKHLKTAGFNLEGFNLDGTHKTNIMMAILAMVYSITVRQSPQEIDLPDKDIIFKNGKTYPRRSTFRKGKTRVSRLKTLDLFLAYFLIILEKIICKYLYLKNLHIVNLNT